MSEGRPGKNDLASAIVSNGHLKKKKRGALTSIDGVLLKKVAFKSQGILYHMCALYNKALYHGQNRHPIAKKMKETSEYALIKG